MRCRGVWLAPEGAPGGALPPGRRLAPRRRTMPTLVGALRALACLLGYLALLGRWQVTPARRALESPIAIACRADLAPCLPSRM